MDNVIIEITEQPQNVAVNITESTETVTVNVYDGEPGPSGEQGEPGAPGQPGQDAITYEKRHAWHAPYSYCGKAPLGSDDDDEVWTVTRITVAADGSTTKSTLANVKWSEILTLNFL